MPQGYFKVSQPVSSRFICEDVGNKKRSPASIIARCWYYFSHSGFLLDEPLVTPCFFPQAGRTGSCPFVFGSMKGSRLLYFVFMLSRAFFRYCYEHCQAPPSNSNCEDVDGPSSFGDWHESKRKCRLEKIWGQHFGLGFTTGFNLCPQL